MAIEATVADRKAQALWQRTVPIQEHSSTTSQTPLQEIPPASENYAAWRHRLRKEQ